MNFFDDSQSVVIGIAPGRMDVMGGIADYSGSLVLQMPIQDQVTAKAAFRNDKMLRVFSENISSCFEISLQSLPSDYSSARQFFSQKNEYAWAAYPVGCLLVLMKEKGIFSDRGIDLHLQSNIPIGKGVSSSAAIEIATMRALQQLYPVEFQGTEMATLAQKAENLIAGAPCGLMDQLASAHGKPDHLLPIRCQPDLLSELISLPEDMRFVGLESGARHVVSGASYTDVRTAAFMGYSIIAMLNGFQRKIDASIERLQLPYHGYLCNISVSDFEEKYFDQLPNEMIGDDFLEKYGGTIDPVTTVDPAKIYQIKNCTKHPVYENERVTAFMELLMQPSLSYADYQQLGEWMYQSHDSYSDCGLGNDQTDELVNKIKAVGLASGVFGAKITGGGSGGTVCVLCRGNKGIATAKRILAEYQQKVGKQLKLIF